MLALVTPLAADAASVVVVAATDRCAFCRKLFSAGTDQFATSLRGIAPRTAKDRGHRLHR